MRTFDEPLTDFSPMPFGRHRGVPLADLPIGYLNTLWHSGLKFDSTSLVAAYIRERISEYQEKYPEVNWK